MLRKFLFLILIFLTVFLVFEVRSILSEKKSFEKTGNDSEIENSEALINFLEQQQFWPKRIDEVGATFAYKEFKEKYGSYNFGTQHAGAHVFGEALYESEDIEGVAICDSTFSFGCYHSFFLEALSEHGRNIVLEMDKACIEKYGVGGVGCQHGIGHGLVQYLGPDKLVEALEVCATLAWKNPLFGCQGGVFMEYTLPTIFDLENSVLSVKDIDDNNPYDVCPQLPDKFQEACYYSLGQWWEKSFAYEKMGQLCARVADSKKREACYLGIGNIVAPSSNYNIQGAIDSCRKMPDFEGELVCRAGASWAFFALPEMRSDSLKLCEGFENDDSEHLCAQKSDLVGERNL